MEDLLVAVADKFILKDTFALVSPKTDQEEFLSNLFFDVVALLDNFIIGLGSYCTNTLEDSAQLTDVEHIMEFGRGRKKSVLYSCPEGNCGINKRASHTDDFRSILLGMEELFQNFTIDIFNRSS